MMNNELIAMLEEADKAEVDEYLDAVLNRKRELFPDWEILYIAYPKDDAAAKQRLQAWLEENTAES